MWRVLGYGADLEVVIKVVDIRRDVDVGVVRERLRLFGRVVRDFPHLWTGVGVLEICGFRPGARG